MVGCRATCLTAASGRKKGRERGGDYASPECFSWALPEESCWMGKAKESCPVKEREECCKEQRAYVPCDEKALVSVSRHRSRED